MRTGSLWRSVLAGMAFAAIALGVADALCKAEDGLVQHRDDNGDPSHRFGLTPAAQARAPGRPDARGRGEVAARRKTQENSRSKRPIPVWPASDGMGQEKTFPPRSPERLKGSISVVRTKAIANWPIVHFACEGSPLPPWFPPGRAGSARTGTFARTFEVCHFFR